MVYRHNAGTLDSGFISVCLETCWLRQKSGFYVPDQYCRPSNKGTKSKVTQAIINQTDVAVEDFVEFRKKSYQHSVSSIYEIERILNLPRPISHEGNASGYQVVARSVRRSRGG